MYKKILKSQRGIAALVALLMVGMLTLIGLAALSTSDDEVAISGNQMQEKRSFYAAEAGLDKACASIRTQFEATGAPPTVMPTGTDSINGCSVTYTTTDNGAATQQVLNTGSLAGLHALVKQYSVTSSGSTSIDQAKIVLSQQFRTEFIPLFQFAVFYGNDLEIAPGPEMILIGRVHSNGNLYVQANTDLKMDSYVSASGHILHGRKAAGTSGSGDILIKNASGVYTSMKQGSDWLDSQAPKWYDSSLARWQGRVRDESHGVTALNVPLTTGSDPHKIIEPKAGNADSYENKATFKIIDNKAYQLVGGVWNDVTAAVTAKGIMTFTPNKFTDQREGKVVDVVDFDVKKMYDSGYAPTNGVMYFSDKTAGIGDYPALRLKNGSTLNAGLTIASANPVYTLGDYNSVAKKPAAILTDALSILSSAWNDANSSLNKTNRVANNTTVNCSYATGNVPSTSTDYNGGFENLPRFLETWNAKTLTWTGSAVCLWYSTQATGTWNSTYYDPPTRNWSYDVSLDDPANLPPESPMVRVFERNGWKQQFVGYTN